VNEVAAQGPRKGRGYATSAAGFSAMAVASECSSSSLHRWIFSNKNKNVACSAGKSREYPGQKEVCLFFFKNKQKEKKKNSKF